jgi:hypothetical protein
MSSLAQEAAHNLERVKHEAHARVNAGTRHAGHHTLPPAQPSASQAAAAKQLQNMLRRVKGHGLGKGSGGRRKKTMKKKNRKHKTHRRSR